MGKIYELGLDFKRTELASLKDDFLLDLKSKEAVTFNFAISLKNERHSFTYKQTVA